MGGWETILSFEVSACLLVLGNACDKVELIKTSFDKIQQQWKRLLQWNYPIKYERRLPSNVTSTMYISYRYNHWYIYIHTQANGRYLHINAQKKLSAAADWATTCFTYTKQSLEHGGWRDPIVGSEFEVSLYLGQSPGLLRWFVWWNTSRNRHTLLITNHHQRVSSWNKLWEIQWK